SELPRLERRRQNVALDIVQIAHSAELGDGLFPRLYPQIQADHVLLQAQTSEDRRLLAAAAARIQQPLARLGNPPALELFLHPADVHVVVESITALALEPSVPARQPLKRVAP